MDAKKKEIVDFILDEKSNLSILDNKLCNTYGKINYHISQKREKEYNRYFIEINDECKHISNPTSYRSDELGRFFIDNFDKITKRNDFIKEFLGRDTETLVRHIKDNIKEIKDNNNEILKLTEIIKQMI